MSAEQPNVDHGGGRVRRLLTFAETSDARRMLNATAANDLSPATVAEMRQLVLHFDSIQQGAVIEAP